MLWAVCFVCALISLIASAAFTVSSRKMKGKAADPTKVLFAGVAVAAAVLSIPVFAVSYENGDTGIVETIFLTIHNVICFFMVGADFEYLMGNVVGVSPWLHSAYSVLFSVLLVVAPVLTFGFVLSFFKNASAMQKYLLHYHSDVYVFSQVNERSLALAKSLQQNTQEDRVIVFTNVVDNVEAERAEELGAICFGKDIAAANILLHSKKSMISFFTIGEDSSENVTLGLELVEKYSERPNTRLYIFSTQEEAEFHLLNAYGSQERDIKIRVRLINEVQSLVLRTLYDDGYKLFENAVQGVNGKKQISAVVVGMGQHGTQMLKALPWFCQMDGYEITVHAFDTSESAQSEWVAKCPELMDPNYNGSAVDGEAQYHITVHSGVNVDSIEFSRQIARLPEVTYVFVALGNDEKNVGTAVKLRSLFTRLGWNPQIQAIVYDSQKCASLAGVRNFKGQEYHIDFIGDMESACSEKVILNSDVEKAALMRHLKWGGEEDFWRFGYNYRSSVASAIHRKMKIACGIPGADKLPEERTEEELWALRKLEHCRWNAYMRAEGYSYAPKRNDLAKQHHCLVPFADLPLSEQIKDDD